MKKKNNLVKLISIIIAMVIMLMCTASSCDGDTTATKADNSATLDIGNKLARNQPTPTDIEYSIPRYLLSKRDYWINGEREIARTLPCPIADMPLGYIVLIDNGVVFGKHIVEGMVMSLNTYLTPDSEYYEIATGATNTYYNDWLPDVDGTYGTNVEGIFFFTPDGLYFEWNSKYLYTDMPIEIDDPVLKVVTDNG